MKRLLCLLFLALPLFAQVNITQGESVINIDIDGHPYTRFFYGPPYMKPFLYPLRAADGTIVTRGFPMEKVEGETTDHPHQRGLWFAHADVNGFDFWNNEPTYKKSNMGHMVMTRVIKLQSGARSGSIEAELSWQDPHNNALLTEHRTMTFYSGSPNRVIDVDITLTPLTKVTFGDEKDGVFGIRIADALRYPQDGDKPGVSRTGIMVSSEGCRDEKTCWGKRAAWMDYFGVLNGEKVGVAIFDHPANPRHPTYWHVRGYGLFAANIFGVAQFTNDPNQDGSMTIAPGQTLRFRYRVVVHPGDNRTANTPKLYSDYSGQR